MSVSIIIPTIRANPPLLEACLDAIDIHEPGPQVILADDPVNFGENCNRGAEKAHGEFLIFLNDDCIIQEGWLFPLLKAFGDDDVGIVGSKLLYPDGRIQHAGVYFDAPGGVLTAHNIQDDIESCDVDAVTGASLAIRADLFQDCDGFDAAFDNGYEDVDLCLRVRQGGWRIRYAAESVAVHYESQSGADRWRSVGANIARLQELWNVHTD